MNTTFHNKSAKRYEDQINQRKAKLEEMRKEREMLQFEKLKRSNHAAQENLEEIRLKKEIRNKVKEINDVEIDKIQSEIDQFKKNSYSTQTVLETQSINKQISPYTKMSILTCSNIQITEFPPIQTATYSKHTQTEHSRLYIRTDVSLKQDYEEDELEYQDDVTPLRLTCKFSSNLPPGVLSPGLPKIMDMPPALTPIDIENPWNHSKEKKKKILDQQCENIILSEDFQKSLNRVSQAMEKVLSKNKNICVDYIAGNNDSEIYDDAKGLLKLNQIFRNKNTTENRCITSIDWSTQCAGQIVASYYKNEKTSFESGDDVLIWNQNYKSDTPEHVFHCHSSVMTVCFTKFNPNLIIGATYSGQIVLWDKRVKTSIPIQCTRLNSKAHTQPIYCLRVIGDDSSHNIISISSDGKLCSWNVDMLGVPLDIMQLQIKISNDTTKPIPVTSMDFPANGINNLVLGGEDGYAYSAFRYGYDSCINNRYERHEAPITSISSHFNQTSSDFGNLFITSSIDGTIKLWSLESSKPLHTIRNNYYYAMDVAWSPVHPAIFIAADGCGHIDLYNLNQNIVEPIKSFNTKGGNAVNRLKWNSNGQQVAIGTEGGELYLYNVAEELSNPAKEEWCRFTNILNGINVNYNIADKE